jgi:signal transduction histidine kinase
VARTPTNYQKNLKAVTQICRDPGIHKIEEIGRQASRSGVLAAQQRALPRAYLGVRMFGNDGVQARETLEKVTGFLIDSQEKDLSHLARELHDDICQRLAMLSLRIEKVTKSWRSGLMSVGDQLEQVRQQCSDLMTDVQALSHELHPSILDHLGLVTAAKSFCRELAQESGTNVEFTARDVPDCLPREVSLSLFRVIQEALHNSVRYSGEKYFEVHLEGKPTEIKLEVSDRGVGFDVANVKKTEGLGLVSMRERIHLLNGTVSIESIPSFGTSIRASVPLGATFGHGAEVWR